MFSKSIQQLKNMHTIAVQKDTELLE